MAHHIVRVVANRSHLLMASITMTLPIPNIETLRRALPLPSSLIALMDVGQWTHPGSEALRSCAPFLHDPLVVLTSIEAMLFNSGPLMGHSQIEDERLHEYRGSVLAHRPLPWIDVEKTIFIMCNERIGDDCGIALDYRTNPEEPHVIGSDWQSGGNGVVYRKIADSFREFAAMVGLSP